MVLRKAIAGAVRSVYIHARLTEERLRSGVASRTERLSTASWTGDDPANKRAHRPGTSYRSSCIGSTIADGYVRFRCTDSTGTLPSRG